MAGIEPLSPSLVPDGALESSGTITAVLGGGFSWVLGEAFSSESEHP